MILGAGEIRTWFKEAIGIMSGLIDRKMLEETFGPEAAREVLDLFLSNVEDTIGRLEAAIESQDHGAGAAAAHEINGTALSVGSGEMATCAKQLELMLNAGNDPRAGEVLAKLKELFGQVRADIAESGSH